MNTSDFTSYKTALYRHSFRFRRSLWRRDRNWYNFVARNFRKNGRGALTEIASARKSGSIKINQTGFNPCFSVVNLVNPFLVIVLRSQVTNSAVDEVLSCPSLPCTSLLILLLTSFASIALRLVRVVLL